MTKRERALSRAERQVREAKRQAFSWYEVAAQLAERGEVKAAAAAIEQGRVLLDAA